MRFECATCGKQHEGVPSYGADRPSQYWEVPEAQRESDIFLTSDSCVIADRFFFVRGCLEVPVRPDHEALAWGVWVSLKEENFLIWQRSYDQQQRAHLGPFFGWLSTTLPGYPETRHLKTMVHLRNDGARPFIALEQTEHPLSIEQRSGISLARLSQIVAAVEHGE